MAPRVTEDEIDDLIYFARAGEVQDFQETVKELSDRENCSLLELLQIAKDEHSGNGPLHMAAANGHTDLLKTVITALSTPPQNPPLLALLNAQNTAGNTPLHWAALNGHLASVQVLVDNGADPTITNKAGHDPVYEAELNDRKEVVEWVLKEGGGGLESGFGGNGEGEGEGEDMGMEDEQEGESSQQQNGQFDAELKKGLESMGFNEEKES